MRPIKRSLTLLSLLLGTLAAAGSTVAAQDGSIGADAAHPIVGAWIAESSPENPDNPLEVVVIGPGGTITDASLGGIGSGAWVPTGERTADVTFVFPATDPEGTFAGFVTVRSSVEVAEDGQSFAGAYTLEFPAALAEALGMAPGQLGPGEVTAQRIIVEPMGEVVGPIPPEPTESGAPGTTPGPGASTVGVTLQEFAVIPESTTLSAGSITFEAQNIGPADPHELVIVRTDIPADELPTREDGSFDEDAAGVEVIGEIEEFAPGTSASGTFELPPGHYAFLCNLVEEEDGELEAHYQFGMWVDVEVS
jgi:uncharacterized cupredoxin-like copper-binding protein